MTKQKDGTDIPAVMYLRNFINERISPCGKKRALGDLSYLESTLTKQSVAIEALKEQVEVASGAARKVSSYLDSIISAIESTTHGKHCSTDYAHETVNNIISAINKTEADRKEALRTAEAFQKAQPKTEQSRGIYLGWSNHHSFDALNYVSLSRNWIQGFDQRVRYESISTEIVDEAIRASGIHPQWPTDALHAVSILTEESGELMKAAIEYHYNNGDIEAVREEAVQTGAMALRVLMNIDKYSRPSDEK